MTQKLTSLISRVATLQGISLPDHAIVILDADLPTTVLNRFENAIKVRSGEDLKTLSRIEEMAELVLSQRSTRPLTLVAVGGGSVTDAVGFLASILWRGVDLWHIPTTLLGMVDSSFGAKTAVNLGDHKNQLGTFYPAKNVILCEEILETLPIPQREQGLAELLKALWLGDPNGLDLWDEVGSERLASAPFEEIRPQFMELLERAIHVKLAIVEEDPFEHRQIRTTLNLGHTVAHALELSVGISHGHAVAWGMCCAAILSHLDHGLSRTDRNRLLGQVYPLLTPILAELIPSVEELGDLLKRDKKSVDGTLRGVFLRGPGSAFVADSTAESWHRSLRVAHDWTDSPVLIQRRTAAISPLKFHVPPSKSQMNRLLVIADLLPNATVETDSDAADVVLMRRGLKQLHQGEVVQVGDGGTTFRFLLARAACIPGVHIFQMSNRLFERPHEPLFESLNRCGARMKASPDSCQVEITGWSEFPKSMSIDASTSSQFASALALLSASGETFSLDISEDIASKPYFLMTLEALKSAGVRFTSNSSHTAISFTGLDTGARALRAMADESSAAVWRCLNRLGLPVEVDVEDISQPDSQIYEFLDSDEEELHVESCPDLTPVLCVTKCALSVSCRIIGGEHLRFKESNRIEDLAANLTQLGVTIATDESSITSAPIQKWSEVRSWQTYRDHRMAFAGLIASVKGPLQISAPMVVSKSYPRFWKDARRLGWSITPITFPLEPEREQE